MKVIDKSKTISTVLLSLFMVNFTFGQTNDLKIKIGTNKVLCLINFLETGSGRDQTSKSYQSYIQDNLGSNEQFQSLKKEYSELDLSYKIARDEYPSRRTEYLFLSTKDLIWTAAVNSSSIDDFGERLEGVYPHHTRSRLIKILKKMEEYYEELVWSKEQENINRIHNQISPYKLQIGKLFSKVSHFYNTNWDQAIPFKTQFYPIPLEKGSTFALKRDNLLVCGFLSHKEDDYKSTLGIIVHEMCHILYSEQEVAFQHQIDQWFKQSESPYADVSYSYFDEGLATAIGNGWAYKKIHGYEDPSSWYNNRFIEGFARALQPLIAEYFEDGKPMDQLFVERAIHTFGETFPHTKNEIWYLMNEIQLFANTTTSKEEAELKSTLRSVFGVPSMWSYSSIRFDNAQKAFTKNKITKLFILDSDQNAEDLEFINKGFPALSIRTPINSIDIFNDNSSNSPVIVINTNRPQMLQRALKILSGIEPLTFGTNHKVN